MRVPRSPPPISLHALASWPLPQAPLTMRLLHEWPDERDLRFVRRTVYVALRYGGFVAVSLPFLGVSSLNFGPLATAAFFLKNDQGALPRPHSAAMRC